jgi:hypothetical protein
MTTTARVRTRREYYAGTAAGVGALGGDDAAGDLAQEGGETLGMERLG